MGLNPIKLGLKSFTQCKKSLCFFKLENSHDTTCPYEIPPEYHRKKIFIHKLCHVTRFIGTLKKSDYVLLIHFFITIGVNVKKSFLLVLLIQALFWLTM
jgi:hypothetical protein